MPSLTRKTFNGRSYYYLRECKRVNGKPKIVWTKYIGTIEKLIELVDKKNNLIPPDETITLPFGNIAILYSIIQELGLHNIIDTRLPKKDQGLKFSDYIIISAINRAIESKSKLQMSEWLKSNALPHIMGIDVKYISSQAFWNHMDKITEEDIEYFVDKITNRVIELYNPSLNTLFYDTTNYFTYVSTFNNRNNIARRGHNEQKRDDLRQVGWALIVTEDNHIPLYQKVYEGNVNDYDEFKRTQSVLKEFKEKFPDKRITYIFDSGNFCFNNANIMYEEGLDFITTLRKVDYKELVEVEKEKFIPLDKRKDILFYRTTHKVYDKELTTIIVLNLCHFEKELMTYKRQVKEAIERMKDLKRRLEVTFQKRNNPPRDIISIQKEIGNILKFSFLKKCISFKISYEGNYPVLNFEYDEKSFEEFIDKFCGKEIIATTRSDLSSEEIIKAKYHQFVIENAFRLTKDRTIGGWWPIYHWTDQKVMVHGFCCYLSLLILSIIKLKLKNFRLNISLESLMKKHASSIYKLTYIYYNKKKKSIQVESLSKLDNIQKEIVEKFRLDRYLKKD